MESHLMAKNLGDWSMHSIPKGELLKNHVNHGRYECGNGYCGQCKCRLLSGSVAYVTPPLIEPDKGFVLPCISIATSNVKVGN